MNIAIIGGGAARAYGRAGRPARDIRSCCWSGRARVGRKLLSTGNGRCNLTNLNIGPSPTITDRTPAFIRPAFEAARVSDATLDFFRVYWAC